MFRTLGLAPGVNIDEGFIYTCAGRVVKCSSYFIIALLRIQFERDGKDD